MEKVRYAEMLPHEIVKRRENFPAAFIGLGTLEWHGEHLAVGNDALKAEKLCELAAAKSGGFAFPTMWYGEPRVWRLMEASNPARQAIWRKMKFHATRWKPGHYRKTEEEQLEFYKSLLYHTLVQMYQLEMKAVCLVCGHYPLYRLARPVVRRFNRDFKDIRVFAGIEFHYPRKSKDVGGDHAAKWETSYLWYLRPDCVDMSVFLGRRKEPLVGVMGQDPRAEATLEIGRKGCDLIVEGMVRKANALIHKVDKLPKRSR